MKSVLKFWAAIAGGLIMFWGLLWLYDLAFSNGDGLLSGIDLSVMLSYLLALVGLLAAATLGTRSRNGAVVNASASLCGLLFFWIIAEIGCLGLIRFGLTDAPEPFHSRVLLTENWHNNRSKFWGDISPEFGRWRIADASIRLPLCTGDTITLSSNRFGMRDRERTLSNLSGKRRAVFIGDSFVEGYLVNAPQRYSDLLEAQTGLEHLNFGINGTSPINYYLTYKFLASRFTHDVVVITLLPANDFEDYTDSDKLSLLRYPIYRPYWRGDFPEVDLAYSLNDIRQSVASPALHNEPALVQHSVDSVYQSLPWGKKVAAEIQLNSYVYSCAMHWAGKAARANPPVKNSFARGSFESRWPAFAHSLEALLVSARGKKIIILGMPILTDVRTYDQQPTDDFSPLVETLCRKYGAEYVNLLPVIHAQGTENWSSFYIDCDGHFSAKGEKLVAHTLLASLAYLHAMGLDSALDSLEQKAFPSPSLLPKINSPNAGAR